MAETYNHLLQTIARLLADFKLQIISCKIRNIKLWSAGQFQHSILV